MDDNAIDRLFSGDLHQLIDLPKRLVRLFISSTFTDMTLERNTLMERVYPRLKKYCREKHGLDFQVVDMRWGVRDEATDDHQTATLCSREIDNCQRMSLGPNFVALLGDKYGFRPLCNRIKSMEYRALRRCLIELDINTDFLDTWYKEDLNAVPPEYLLQPISSILKNFTNKKEPELQAVDQRIWQAIQERLHELLMIGSNRLVQQGRMSQDEQLIKYSISVTEREVIEGCLDLKDAKSQCVVFVRSIQDIESHLNKCLSNLTSFGNTSSQRLDSSSSVHSSYANSPTNSIDQRRDSQARKASLKIGEDSISLTTSLAQTTTERRVEKSRKLIGKYIDLLSKDNVWRLDEEAQAALSKLKREKLEAKLKVNGRNLIKFNIMWNEAEGISSKCDEHKQYLNEMSEHFLNNMTRMIRKASKSQQQLKFSGLIGEVLQHSHYAKHLSKSFHGRSYELNKIKAYLTLNLLISNHQQIKQQVKPMFIYGVVGSGKTSIMAKAATLCKEWYNSIASKKNASDNKMIDLDSWNQKPCVIMRFCCTTPSSSSMEGVLTSICRQLQYNFYQYGPLNGSQNNKDSFEQTSSLTGLLGGKQESQLPAEQIPEDYVRLVFTFRQLLENCQHELHRQRLFVILLDSVERLSSPSGCSIELKYSWLTSISQLPSNVRLVISCSSERTLESLAADYKHLKYHFLELYFDNYKCQKQHNEVVKDSRVRLIDETDKNSKLDSLIINNGENGSNDVIGDEVDDKNSFDDNDLLDQSNSYEKIEQHYRYLKRILIPSVKFKRGSKLRNNKDETKIFHCKPHETGRSDNKSLLMKAALKQAKEDSDENKSPPRDTEIGLEDVYILHIRPLGIKLAVEVLKRWLNQIGRNLTGQQWSIVEASFGHCSRPIFVKLAFGEIINWKSYSTQSDSRGLTFGSSLINNDNNNNDEDSYSFDRSNILTGDQEFDDHLIKLMAESETGQRIGGIGFEQQILDMEQEWLNYLEYIQRKRQQLAMQETSDQNEANQDGSLVIRVATNTSDGVKSGSSSHSSSICHLSNTIEDAICQLFARIELQHGYILTKHSLSYITAARNGICENELEDILSLDDVVLDDVFQYHLPPVRRIPPLLWTRIRNDLADYLSERDADGIVVNWHHGQFKQVVERRYLSDNKQLLYIHSLLSDYFLGKWADKAKPFRCTKQQIQLAADQLESAVQQSIRDSQAFSSGSNPRASISGAGGRLVGGSASGRVASFSVRSRLRSSDQHDARLQWMQAKADRRVAQQPLYYLDNKETTTSSPKSSIVINDKSSTESLEVSSKNRRYNMRKLKELPFHLLRAGRFLDFAQNILFNYNWLSSALAATGLQSLLADFRDAADMLEEALAKCLEKTKSEPEKVTALRAQPTGALFEQDGISLADELEIGQIKSIIKQLNLLNNTIRLSSSTIHSDTQMLAPQLIARLLPIVEQSNLFNHDTTKLQPPLKLVNHHHQQQQNNYLQQLLTQCDKDGSSDIALLPIDHFLQSPDGLELSSLEGHAFSIMAITMAADRRHLLSVSNRFIMWDISTGEISRDIDPKIGASIMKALKMGSTNEYAIAYTSDNVILLLNILTQQVIKFFGLVTNKFSNVDNNSKIIGLELIDRLRASKFVVWSRNSWHEIQVIVNNSSISGQTDPITLELCHSFDLADFDDEGDEIIRVQMTEDSCFAFVETKITKNNLESVQLLTFSRNKQGISRVWRQRIQADSLTLHEDNLRQLVFSDSLGDIYLSRRRQTCWSKPKLLLSNFRDHKSECPDFLQQSNSMLIDQDNFHRSIIDITEKKSVKPLSIKLESKQKWDHYESMKLLNKNIDNKRLDKLSQFERDVDRLKNQTEIKGNYVFGEVDLIKNRENGNQMYNLNAVHYVKLYFSDKISILTLWSNKSTNRAISNLMLPKSVRNISLETNRSQMSSIIMKNPKEANIEENKQIFVVVAIGRKILLYDLQSENFLRSIDSHQARIVELVPIYNLMERNNNKQDDMQLIFASASMDKTVKIWNLLNVDKDVYLVDKMSSSIESIRINQQKPLAACISRGELGLWDWRTLKLITKISQSNIISKALKLRQENSSAVDMELELKLNKSKWANDKDKDKIVECCFSFNGRYLLLATTSLLCLLTLDQSGSSTSSPSSSMSSKQTISLNDKLTFVRALFRGSSNETFGGLVRKLAFFLQDSRALIIIERNLTSTISVEPNLRLLCYSIPDGRLVYSIDCRTPIVRPSGLGVSESEGSAQFSKRRSSEILSGNRITPINNSQITIRKPVLTRDQMHVVVVEDEGRVLAVYSARDGLLVRKIDLTQLESYSANLHQINQQSTESTSISSSSSASASSSSLNLNLKGFSKNVESSSFANQVKVAPNTSNSVRQIVSISAEQFTKIKAVIYRDRQSVVALLNSDSAMSFLVDVKTKQFLASSNVWNGKISFDGRYGLSRLFKSSRSASVLVNQTTNVVTTTNNQTARLVSGLRKSTTNANNESGLQLLEMRHFAPLKSLLTNETLSKLSSSTSLQASSGSSWSRNATSLSTGNETDVTCGFLNANDSYVYYHDSRLTRLLLIRVRDARLVANYKLTTFVTKIKSSPDGLALILGQLDGGLGSLAIVDPEKNDTLLRLAQYPSRARVANVATNSGASFS